MFDPSESGRIDGLARVSPGNNTRVVHNVVTQCTIGEVGNAWPLASVRRTRRSRGVGNVRRGGQQCFPFTNNID